MVNIHDSRVLFFIFCTVIIAIFIDTSITRLSVYTGGLNTSSSSIIIFAFMIIIYGVAQIVILRADNLLRMQNDKYRTKSWIAVFAFQLIILVLLIIILVQMLLIAKYSNLLLQVLICLNYSSCATLLGILAHRLFLWFKSRKNLVVLVYGIGMIMLSANAIFTVLFLMDELTAHREIEYVKPLKSAVSLVLSSTNAYNLPYVLTSVLSFVITWFGTVLLLYHYSRKIGSVKYWIIMVIPLLYFLSQFQLLFFNIFSAFRHSDPILYGITFTLIFAAIKPIGGILFGFAFWTVSRNLRNDKVRLYMMISAYGLALLFSSNQSAGLALMPYPPFGLVTISFLGLASYLIFNGVYSAALSAGQDVELRRAIKKSVQSQYNLLGNISAAQAVNLLQGKVLRMTKDLSEIITEQTGVESSLVEEDYKGYLHLAIEELKGSKERQEGNKLDT